MDATEIAVERFSRVEKVTAPQVEANVAVSF